MRVFRFSFALAILLVVGAISAAEKKSYTGPWDVERILDTATPALIDEQTATKTHSIAAIRYPSEPYQGHDTHVFAYYAKPLAGNGPHPAMLLVHGGGGKAYLEWAEMWADRGYVALAMDLAGHGPNGKRLDDGGPDQDDGTKFRPFDDSNLHDMWTHQAVAAVLRGHAFLASQPEVDPARIGITGISWGGYLTCIIAGIDHRLKVAVPIYGCGYLAESSVWEDRDVFAKMPADARDRWIRNFDPSQYLPGIQCPTLFVNGTNDGAYPLDSYQKSYQLVTAPRKLCVTVNMPHSHPDGWAGSEIEAFVDSVLDGGKPLATLSPIAIGDVEAATAWESPTPITQAELHYTTDSGPWQDRKWTTIAAKRNTTDHRITAELPTARPLTCFITARDERGFVVSTEHVELGE